MSKIDLRVTKLAFYNGGLVYPNEIIKNYSYLIINYRLQAINNVKYYLIVMQLKYLCYFCAVLII